MVITGAGPGIMAAGMEGAGREQLLRRQHPPAVRAGGQRVHRRRPEARLDEVLLHPQAHADEGVAGLRVPARRLRHPGRDLRAAHPAADGQGRCPTPIVLLDAPGGTYWERWRQFVLDRVVAGGYVDEEDLSLRRRSPTTSRWPPTGPRLLPQLPLDPLGRRLLIVRLCNAADRRGAGRPQRRVRRPPRRRQRDPQHRPAARGGRRPRPRRAPPPRPASSTSATSAACTRSSSA